MDPAPGAAAVVEQISSRRRAGDVQGSRGAVPEKRYGESGGVTCGYGRDLDHTCSQRNWMRVGRSRKRLTGHALQPKCWNELTEKLVVVSGQPRLWSAWAATAAGRIVRCSQ